MANLEIMLMVELECLLEVGRDYRQPSLFVNESNVTFSIHSEIPMLHAKAPYSYLSVMDLMVWRKVLEHLFPLLSPFTNSPKQKWFT